MIIFPGLLGNIAKSITSYYTWKQQSILSGTLATDTGDLYGGSVGINSTGNRIIVGSNSDERSGQLSGQNEGLVYIYDSGSSGWTQSQILSGSLANNSSDFFGGSVSINSVGDRIIVGSANDERTTGNTNVGLAYLFVSSSSGWTQQQIFSGSLAVESSDFFGIFVTINSVGNIVAISATGDENITGNAGVGLVYVFSSGSSGWIQESILSGSLATETNDFFGRSVAINSAGDRIIVGADGDERISGSAGEGVAYIFVSGSSGWVQQQILSGSLANNLSDSFGHSVGITSIGDRVIVSAINDENITGNGGIGLAYIFSSSSVGWIQDAFISGSLATSSGDAFGRSVSINPSGNCIAVGAYQDERVSGSASEGLAYIFVSGSSGWQQQAVLSGSLAVESTDNFGQSIKLNSSGDRVVVGAYQDENVTGNTNTGLAYVFTYGS
jgi:mucin-19